MCVIKKIIIITKRYDTYDTKHRHTSTRKAIKDRGIEKGTHISRYDKKHIFYFSHVYTTRNLLFFHLREEMMHTRKFLYENDVKVQEGVCFVVEEFR